MVQIKVGNSILETRQIRSITPCRHISGGDRVTGETISNFRVVTSSGKKTVWSRTNVDEYINNTIGLGVIQESAVEYLTAGATPPQADNSEEMTVAENRTMH